ncbi:MAG: hypothetical protein LJF15_16090 [Acidobacteria bacterium]|nr:hypothetical protein [Acidobacteriota bacterium]
MKKNPFYGMSAAAMLFGCYMVNHALGLEPGRLGKLLTLMGVLQVYEGLLIALGVYLVATRRAPRDGVTVLVLETLFLLDATFLATECVTASSSVGSVVAVALVALAVGKLAVVRHVLPDTLPRPAAVLLGLQTVLVFGLPVVAVQLAAARLLAPVSFYSLWWLTLALPPAQKKIQEASASAHDEADGAHAAWTWIPATSVLIHLAALGWIHQVVFRPAFLAPFLLGLAVCAGREQVVRQIGLPAAAALFSVGQADALAFPLLGTAGPWISPLRLAILGAATAYALLAWRHGYRWLVSLAAASGLAGLLGPSASSLGERMTDLLRLAGRMLPRNALGWGLSGVVGAFVFLALGAWRSLRGSGPRRSAPPPARRRTHPRHGDIALALLLAALAAGSMLSALDTQPIGHPQLHGAALTATGLMLVTFVLGLRAHSRTSRPPEDAVGKQAATLALVAGLGGLLSLPLFAATRHHPARSESSVIGDIRTVISAQAAYGAQNGGYADGALGCLVRPSSCIPGYGGDQASLLDAPIATLVEKRGYTRSFHPGPRPDQIPSSSSPTSVTTWAYTAVPVDPGYTGVRGFCGDSNGDLCFTVDGTAPPLRADGTCDLGRCAPLQ